VRLGAIALALANGRFPQLLAVSLLGWIALAGFEQSLMLPGLCSAAAGSWLDQGGRGIEAALAVNPPPTLIVSWLTMLLAMMPPLLQQPVAHLWDRSFACRRPRAIAMFVVGYGAIWMAAGLSLLIAAIIVGVIGKAVALPAAIVAVAVALAWQSTPLKQICLNRCHRLPRLSAFGIAADRDCLRYGVGNGVWCVGTCWALMLIPLVANGMHVAIMATVAVLTFAERRAPARPPRWRLPVPV
jgi:predicted metal-binding membrane protein